MNALQKAQARSRAMATSVETRALQLKEAGMLDLTASAVGGGFDQYKAVGANKQSYSLFKGWMYSAIHALAQKAAGQHPHVGKLLGAKNQEKSLSLIKDYQLQKMTPGARAKSHEGEIEMVPDHPFLDIMDQPNPVQNRAQFIYSFVANLNISGTAYVIADQEEGRMVLYSLPTTWVIPDHTDGPFSSFKVVDPKDPLSAADAKPIPKENVGRAYFPNPSDPLGSLSPVQSQMSAIRIDENIQTSQERHFENGVFPSVIVSIGKSPLDGMPGAGMRQRLSGAQRRMINSSILKTWKGIHNSGQPIIVDGLIDDVRRFSSTQNEMGWDKSEDKIVTRILSAFAVHRFILGDVVPVGGYAQAAVIWGIFCDRVNMFLDMAGGIFTKFANTGESEKFIVWLEKCEPTDANIQSKNMLEGRKNGDVTRNEYRAFLGLPPLEEEEAERSKLLDAVGGIQQVTGLLRDVGQGSISPEAGIETLSLFLQITPEQAARMVGTGPVQQTEEEVLGEANEALNGAVAVLQVTPKQIAGRILETV